MRPLLKRRKVSIDRFEGLLVHYARKRGAQAVVRGLRAISDFEYEFQMALMNRRQDSSIEAIYFMSDEKYTYLSSQLLKEIVRMGGRIEHFVPPVLIPKIRRKLLEIDSF